MALSIQFSDHHLRWVRRGVSVFLFSGLMVAVLSYRLFTDGKRSFEGAEQARIAGESWQRVVSLYEDAAKTYFPGNPFSHRAVWRLSILAQSAAMEGDDHRAAYVWDVVRRSALSQRHFVVPYESYVRRAENELERIRGKRAKTAHSQHDGLEDPGAGASLLITFGILLWIVGALGAFTARSKTSLFFFGGSVLGTVIWILAVVFA